MHTFKWFSTWRIYSKLVDNIKHEFKFLLAKMPVYKDGLGKHSLWI